MKVDDKVIKLCVRCGERIHENETDAERVLVIDHTGADDRFLHAGCLIEEITS